MGRRELGSVHWQRFLPLLDGFLMPAGCRVEGSAGTSGRKCHSVVAAVLPLMGGERRFSQRDRLVVAAERGIAAGEISHAREHLPMFRAQPLGPNRQCDFAKTEGLLVPAKGSIVISEII